MTPAQPPSIGAVAIGKNEGERLKVCLRSVAQRTSHFVYVDSGSRDGSVEFARSIGADVIELGSDIPFTAGRARNAGMKRLVQVAPEVKYAQLIDGDCELIDGWIEGALSFLEKSPEYAVAAGRLRERFPEATVYNYLCDAEWDTPVGDTEACGGIAMMRVDAFFGVDGFLPGLIAGEEPELCVRLRQGGWKIRRLDLDMAFHDSSMSRFSQWWKRTRRAGHAYAEVASLHGKSPGRMWGSESRRIVTWGLALPLLSIVSVPITGGLSLVLLLAYPLNVIRIAGRLRRAGESRAWTRAFFLVLGKFPEALGWLRFHRGKITGKRSRIIEYKGA